jgi:hypothetical protein
MNQLQLVASDCLTFEWRVITVCNSYSNMKNFTFCPQNDLCISILGINSYYFLNIISQLFL